MKRYLAILAVGFVLAGCTGKPALLPEEEASYNEIASLIDSTKIDLDTAAKAGANEYAPDSMLQARSDLQTASTTLDTKDFDKAKEYANKAGREARSVLTLPVNAQNTINDAESLLNSAKVSGADISSPDNYKEAYDNLNAAKIAYDKNIFDLANSKAVASAEASKRATFEPSSANRSIKALSDSLKLAKDLQMDTLKSDTYTTAAAALDASKADFAEGKLPKAAENADKAKAALDGEMRTSVELAVQQARGDINTAKEGGASEFASEKLADAEIAFSASNSALQAGEFLNAKKNAEKASAAAKAAAENARTGKQPAAVAQVPAAAEETTSVNSARDVDMEPGTISQSQAVTVPPIVTREKPKTESANIEPVKETKAEDQPAMPRKTGLQPTPADTAKAAPGAPLEGNMAVPIGVGVVIVITCLFLIRSLRMKITAAKKESELQNQEQNPRQ